MFSCRHRHLLSLCERIIGFHRPFGCLWGRAGIEGVAYHSHQVAGLRGSLSSFNSTRFSTPLMTMLQHTAALSMSIPLPNCTHLLLHPQTLLTYC
ncbi:hypothetical protein FGO68_gene1313 [Halteria grandinella]|uniref:Uncharacterized protein n=1 Tax=Halteria grandinella TaxID=5974 RepID=A0A8J8T8A0_HALGN|nr:hypothetical protein FGO68_gene1313 [Halteria grandinella]